jgi:heme/copper-type cytochrome/quinol oxidase subunit 3
VSASTPGLPAVARFRGLALVMSAVLLGQFFVGMVVNLYVVVPRSHPGAKASNYFSGVVNGVAWAIAHAPWSLAVHAALGLLLVLGSFGVIALAARYHSRGQLVLAILAAAFVLGAGFNGASFLDYGHAVSSLVMSGCFALALACYGWLIYATRRAAGVPTAADAGARPPLGPR